MWSALSEWLARLPLWVAQICVLTLFVAAGAWALMLPREFIYLDAPDRARWRDLRIWAVLFLVPYVTLYVVLGR